MKSLLLLRPEPGLSQSAARAAMMGLPVVSHPLFRVEGVAAEVPAGPFDGLVLTSANAVRFGRAIIRALGPLPVHAVGEATAAAARAAGLSLASIGSGGVDGMRLPEGRLLHLTGETHRPIAGIQAITVYRAVPIDRPLPPLSNMVVAVHSPAAGRQLDVLAGEDRADAQVAAISDPAATACGLGWARVRFSETPDDAALLALAAALCQSDPA